VSSISFAWSSICYCTSDSILPWLPLSLFIFLKMLSSIPFSSIDFFFPSDCYERTVVEESSLLALASSLSMILSFRISSSVVSTADLYYVWSSLVSKDDSSVIEEVPVPSRELSYPSMDSELSRFSIELALIFSLLPYTVNSSEF